MRDYTTFSPILPFLRRCLFKMRVEKTNKQINKHHTAILFIYSFFTKHLCSLCIFSPDDVILKQKEPLHMQLSKGHSRPFTCCNNYSLNLKWIVGKYSQRHYWLRLKRIIVLVYTHEVISTKSERKPLKSTIWLTDQITRKFKNRSLQNFQTRQFTSLSFRKQQRNGLNETAKSLNCFFTWEEKYSYVVLCWLAKYIAKRACCVVLRMKCWQKWRLGCSG